MPTSEYQETGWPAKGFEVQVNNTYPGDPRLTGSLYEVADNTAEVAKDNEPADAPTGPEAAASQ